MILLALVAGALPAPQSSFSPGPSIPWTLASADRVARCVAADVTGDRVPELVAHVHLSSDGEGPVDAWTVAIAYGPGIYQAPQDAPLTLEVRDFDVAHGLGPDGAAALVAVNDDGAFRLDYSGAGEGQFDAVEIDTGAAWREARLVRVADLLGGGTPGLIGLDAAGTGVLLRTDLEPGTTTHSIELPSPALDLIPVDWDGAGVLEVAAFCADGLHLVTPAGASLQSAFTWPLVRAQAVTFRQPSSPHERIALIGEATGLPGQVLRVFDRVGSESLALGEVDAYALAAGDFDGDQLADLVVAHRDASGEHEPWLFLNQSASQSATFGPFETIDLGVGSGPGPDQEAWPVAADLDRDGDADLATFVAATGSLEVRRNDAIDHTALRLAVDEAFAENAQLGSPDELRLQLRLRAADPAAFDASPLLAGTNAVQVHTWLGVQDAGGAYRLDELLGVSVHPFAAGAVLGGSSPQLLQTDDDPLRWLGGPTEVHFLDVAPAVVDAGGEVIATGPPRTFAATFSDAVNADVESQFGASSVPALLSAWLPGGSGDPIYGPTTGGGHTPVDDPPGLFTFP